MGFPRLLCFVLAAALLSAAGSHLLTRRMLKEYDEPGKSLQPLPFQRLQLERKLDAYREFLEMVFATETLRSEAIHRLQVIRIEANLHQQAARTGMARLIPLFADYDRAYRLFADRFNTLNMKAMLLERLYGQKTRIAFSKIAAHYQELKQEGRLMALLPPSPENVLQLLEKVDRKDSGEVDQLSALLKQYGRIAQEDKILISNYYWKALVAMEDELGGNGQLQTVPVDPAE
jgi:hypothetical protein